MLVTGEENVLMKYIDKLPRSVVMSNYNISIDLLEFKTEMAHARTGDTFLQITVTKRLEEVMFLLFTGGLHEVLMK